VASSTRLLRVYYILESNSSLLIVVSERLNRSEHQSDKIAKYPSDQRLKRRASGDQHHD
jgi:hypothetical protein